MYGGFFMICNNCGQTVPDGIKSCPHCGTTYIYTSAPVNPVAERLCAVFSDKLFFTASVLSAVKVGISFLLGTVDVISLLFAIFLLTIYFKAKKGALTPEHLRYTSGCVFANIIVNWVCVGLFAVGAILLTLCAGLLYFTFMKSGDLSVDIFSMSMDTVLPVMYLGIAVLYLIIAAGFVVSNLFFYRPAHKFAKKLYTDYQNGVLCEYKTKSLRGWLMVMAGVNVASMLFTVLVTAIVAGFMPHWLDITTPMAMSDMFSSMYYLCLILSCVQAFVVDLPGAAAFFALSVWLKKHF